MRRLYFKAWVHEPLDVEVLLPFQNNDLREINFVMPDAAAHCHSLGTQDIETGGLLQVQSYTVRPCLRGKTTQ